MDEDFSQLSDEELNLRLLSLLQENFLVCSGDAIAEILSIMRERDKDKTYPRTPESLIAWDKYLEAFE